MSGGKSLASQVLQDWTDLVVQLSDDLSNEMQNTNKHQGFCYENPIGAPLGE